MSESHNKLSRRRLLAAAGGVAIMQTAAGERVQVAATDVPPDPTKVPGAPATSLGARSPFEQPEHVTQRLARPLHPHLDGADRNAKDVGDVSI